MAAWQLRVSVFTAWRVYAAEALAGLGDRDEAVRLLEEELAQPDTGSPWLRKQAQMLYDRLCGAGTDAGPGMRPPAATEELHTLSRAEHRVAHLAQDGLTNREIAEQLGVTPSTVEQHLTRIYRKLGLRGRAELSVALNSVGTPEG